MAHIIIGLEGHTKEGNIGAEVGSRVRFGMNCLRVDSGSHTYAWPVVRNVANHGGLGNLSSYPIGT